MKIKFKIAALSDIPGIVDLCNECFDENTPTEKAIKIFNETMHDPNQIYLIGIMDDKIVAHTRIAIVKTMFDGMDTFAILNHVCVKPDYRHHHIATHMLDAIKTICIQKGCCAIKLWSRNFRVPAHTCYKRFGFIADDATFFSLEIGE